MKKTIAHSAKLATLTAALALCGTAFAATGSAASTSPGASAEVATTSVEQSTKQMSKKGHHRHGHRHGHGRMHDAAMWVPGYGPLDKEFVDTLSLNDDQLKLVEAARAEQKAGRAERRDAMKAAHKEKLEQLKSGKLDPQAALKQKDEGRQKLMDERRKVDEKWLAVWKGLDDSQQQKVATHFNERAEKFAKRMQERKDRKAKAESTTS
ncbi:hypothetical protein LKR43_03875 [Pusillimonas sp. MFBS29]|uniref:hypothetical protein n=1 Tax=Pusillimonas sp. MFBS29 TaxID=2886690 RepID=UPI001D1008B7|nr:hypothetical protein [Pusillimonas sp. MFBS29]MCC2595473.1 hypothetical protein [Pusillimonas sp. MFBS29]